MNVFPLRRSLDRAIGYLTSGLLRKRFDFRQCVSIIATYNEGDIIYHSLRRLIDQGIGVYLIDNWSTDDSEAQIKPLLGRGIVGYEKFPKSGPSPYFSLRQQLERKEEVAQALEAQWIIHQDVDEIRDSPWPGVSLKEGLERVTREGYNCINHTVLRFRPTDNGFPYRGDMERYFKHFTFERHPAFLSQTKAWLRTPSKLCLASSGGHSVEFEGKRVYPIHFILKHYPVRSQAHGERKVLAERNGRFDPEERAMNWHVHYAHVNTKTRFVADPSNLKRYDSTETKNYLLQHPLQPDNTVSFE